MTDRRIRSIRWVFLLLFAAATSAAAAPVTEIEPSDIDLQVSPEVSPPLSDHTQLPIPDDAQAMIDAATESFADGDLRTCRETLRTAYARFPELPPPNLVLASLYLASGKLETGRRLLDDVAEQYPENPEVYVLFGNLALNENHLTDARLQFDRAASLETPSSWTSQQRDRFKLSVRLGRAALAEKRGNWKAAAALLGGAVQIDRRNPELRDRWASALFRSGEHDKAYEEFDIAFRQDENVNVPEVSMGVMHAQTGNWEKSDDWLKRAVDKYPAKPAIYFEYCLVLLTSNRPTQAREAAAKAAELGMGTPQLFVHRGLIEQQLGNYEEAERFFSEVLEDHQDNFAASNNLALVLIESKDEKKRQQALEIASASAAKYPEHATALATLGWVKYRLGLFDEAEQLLRKAASSSRVSLTTLYFLGRVLQQQKHHDQAHAIALRLQQGLSQPGVFVLRPQAKRWLKVVLDE